MAATIDSVLEASFVLSNTALLGTDSEKEAFITAANTEVISEPGIGILRGALSAAPIQDTHRLTLNSDRIQIDLQQARTTIRLEYPSNIGALDRLSAIVNIALRATKSLDGPAFTFGYNVNFMFEYGTDDPVLRYIAKRLISPTFIADKADGILGGKGTVIYSLNGRTWQAQIEPRFGDPNSERVYVALNCHFEECELPSNEVDVGSTFREVWQHAQEIVHYMNEQP